MFRIDALTLTDLPGALRLSTQAGWNQLDADWRRLLDLWPATCLAGRDDDGHLIATATLAVYGDVGWVGMVLVDEARRGRGHGGAMLDAVLNLGRSRGVRAFGLDATGLGRPVYLKRGFSDATPIDRWVRAGAPPAHESSTRHVAVPDVSLDHDASGVDRSALLAHLAGEAGVVVAQRGGKGYGVRRPGRLADHVGPVVATSEAAAEEALDELLPSSNGAVLIDIPRGRLERWLPAHGFQVARRLTRMQTTADTPLLTGPHVYAAAAFELG